MAKKDYQKALERFTFAIEEAPGSSRFRDAYIGQFEALMKLGKLDEAEKLGIELLSNRDFKGEPGGQVYLLLGDLFRTKSKTGEKEENLRKANGYYVNAYARFKAFPQIAAEGLIRSIATLEELGDAEGAATTRKILEENPKFEKFRK
jgi:tetratricopeptide (TPR) repeat protein